MPDGFFGLLTHKSMPSKYIPYLVIGGVLVLVGFLFLNQPPRATVASDTPQLTVYKSATCGCCAQYIAYLKREGFAVETVNTEDMAGIKQQYGIPGQVQSCHTTVAGELAMEGHIPAEVLRTFMESPGNAKGIALPGMPSGSPGMPGAKQGAFTIHQFGDDGVSTFTTF